MSLVSYMFIAACILQVEACNYNKTICQGQAQSGKCCPQCFTDCYNDDGGADPPLANLTCNKNNTEVKACKGICGGDEGNEQKCEQYCKDFTRSSKCKPSDLPKDGACDGEIILTTSAPNATIGTWLPPTIVFAIIFIICFLGLLIWLRRTKRICHRKPPPQEEDGEEKEGDQRETSKM